MTGDSLAVLYLVIACSMFLLVSRNKKLSNYVHDSNRLDSFEIVATNFLASVLWPCALLVYIIIKLKFNKILSFLFVPKD